ncbi:uncharacterized protein LOC121151045 [Ochotona curzoniae]|uniref:uncharacterized protein LOC121151045 n=1 Tax=Ochotona curzoniae TaxID=130825 RepID=UPI001B34EEBD|nr:uncharacterized protein LOC121151045 [Ochotona curzoniae]
MTKRQQWAQAAPRWSPVDTVAASNGQQAGNDQKATVGTGRTEVELGLGSAPHELPGICYMYDRPGDLSSPWAVYQWAASAGIISSPNTSEDAQPFHWAEAVEVDNTALSEGPPTPNDDKVPAAATGWTEVDPGLGSAPHELPGICYMYDRPGDLSSPWAVYQWAASAGIISSPNTSEDAQPFHWAEAVEVDNTALSEGPPTPNDDKVPAAATGWTEVDPGLGSAPHELPGICYMYDRPGDLSSPWAVYQWAASAGIISSPNTSEDAQPFHWAEAVEVDNTALSEGPPTPNDDKVPAAATGWTEVDPGLGSAPHELPGICYMYDRPGDLSSPWAVYQWAASAGIISSPNTSEDAQPFHWAEAVEVDNTALSEGPPTPNDDKVPAAATGWTEVDPG